MCHCNHGKHPDFIAKAAELMDIALELYAELSNPDWCSDDAQPEELTEAVDKVQQHHGNHPSGDYAEAVDWCGFVVGERALEEDGYIASECTRREGDAERASMRGEG